MMLRGVGNRAKLEGRTYDVFSLDTDVMVLVIANYDRLPKNTTISMASSVQLIEPIWTALGSARAKALPGIHASSGTDNTGRFLWIGKKTWLTLFMDAGEDITETFVTLCREEGVSEKLLLNLSKFVCTAYHPKGIQLSNISQ